MKLRSALGRVRGLGSAKNGFGHWWHQRLTAIALVPLSLWFVNAILAHMHDDHAAVVNWIGSPFVSVLLIALILSLFYHAKLGLQVVIEDYLHDEPYKLVALVAMKFAVAFGALLGVVAVLKISLGMA